MATVMPLIPAVAAASVSANVAVTPNTTLVTTAVFFLSVTAAAAGAGDFLDVFIQHSLDDVNWDDFVHFTQVLGNGGAKKLIAHWSSLATPTTPIHALTDGALAAGVFQGPVASTWRVKYVITPAATTVAAGSNGVNTSTFAGAGTLNVASAAAFPSAGTIIVATGGTPATITYTGTGGTTFTGCTTTAGGGVLATGGAVTNASQLFTFNLRAALRRE